MDWAKVRLDARVGESPGVGRALLGGYGRAGAGGAGGEYRTRDSVTGALGCLAAGEPIAARDTLVFLGRHQSPSGLVPASCSTAGVAAWDEGEATAFYLLLVARYHAWTGDNATVQREWSRVLRAYDVCVGRLGADASGASGRLERQVLRELTVTAEAIGDRGAGVEIRRSTGGESMSGEAVGDDRGVWRPNAPPRPSPEEVLLQVVDDLLGAEPDAARGRLVLRPTPPAAWSRFGVRNLRLGDAAIGVTYRRSGDQHSFRFRQDRGGVPVRLILEPSLPGGSLRSAAVDGVAAELDARVEAGRVVVPLQLVLDHERVVQLVLEPAPAG